MCGNEEWWREMIIENKKEHLISYNENNYPYIYRVLLTQGPKRNEN